jgi:hypothetical protein
LPLRLPQSFKRLGIEDLTRHDGLIALFRALDAAEVWLEHCEFAVKEVRRSEPCAVTQARPAMRHGA